MSLAAGLLAVHALRDDARGPRARIGRLGRARERADRVVLRGRGRRGRGLLAGPRELGRDEGDDAEALLAGLRAGRAGRREVRLGRARAAVRVHARGRGRGREVRVGRARVRGGVDGDVDRRRDVRAVERGVLLLARGVVGRGDGGVRAVRARVRRLVVVGGEVPGGGRRVVVGAARIHLVARRRGRCLVMRSGRVCLLLGGVVRS
jgi:hypothetical protein